MIEIDIDDCLKYNAKYRLGLVVKKSNNLSKYGSERKRIFEGYLGEEISKDLLGLEQVDDEFDYDLISKRGNRIEVKTVSCSFKPMDNYLCTVNSHSEDYVHKQKADYYLFLRILNDYSKCWVLGWISCNDFFNKGRFVKKGTDFGKFKFVKANATVLEISELNKFNELYKSAK